MTYASQTESAPVPAPTVAETPPAATSDATNGALIHALNACLETCFDGQKGYGAAAADIRDAGLKGVCEQSAHQRGTFVVALQGAIQSLGGAPENEGTFQGPMHRTWMSLRRFVQVHDDRIVLEGCAEGEQASIRIYEAADRAVLHPAPVEIRAMIQEQYAAIQRAYADLRARLSTPA